MVDIYIGLLLGAVEGFTEFIPVSSTAHLLLASKILGLDPQIATVNSIVVQASSVLGLAIYFSKESLSKSRSVLLNKTFFKHSLLCAGIFSMTALLLENVVKTYFFSTKGIVLGLLIGSLLIFLSLVSKLGSKPLTLKRCLAISAIQTLALIPGVSRSGAVISAGILAGLSLRDAVRFSFFQALILLTLAAGYESVKSFDIVVSHLNLVCSAFVAGVVSSVLAIRILDKLDSRRVFVYFLIYRVCLGIVILLNV